MLQHHLESKVWLIKGIFRGLGLALAKAVLSTGAGIYSPLNQSFFQAFDANSSRL